MKTIYLLRVRFTTPVCESERTFFFDSEEEASKLRRRMPAIGGVVKAFSVQHLMTAGEAEAEIEEERAIRREIASETTVEARIHDANLAIALREEVAGA